MTRYRLFVASLSLLGSIAFAAGCRATPDESKGTVESGEATRAVLEQAAEADYTPPADGLLTEAQVAMYLAVEARAAEIRAAAMTERAERAERTEKAEKPEGAGGTAEALEDDETFRRDASAELTAAQELGYNPREVEWVHERVLEARMAGLTLSLAAAAAAGRQDFLAALEEEKKGLSDPVRIAEIEQRILAIRKSAAESQAGITAAMRANIALLEGHEEALDRLAQAALPEATSDLAPRGQQTAAEDRSLAERP